MSGKRKILLVSNGFFPEISPRSFRATELAKEFSRQGHEVTVLTKFRDYNYEDFLSETKLKFKMWPKARFPELTISSKAFFSNITRGLARLFRLLIEYPSIEEMFQVNKVLSEYYDYDMLISFAVPYPVHWGVSLARSKSHRIADVWVADCGDPYMGDVLDTFKKPFYFKYLEKSFCRKADYISIPVDSAKPAYYPEFHSKIRIIPQGLSFDIERNSDKHIDREIVSFAYAGGFIPVKRDPTRLLESLMKVDIPFKFYVFTNMAHYLDPFKKVLQDKLVVSDYIPRNELLKRLSKMDFLVNFDNNTTLNVPSKLIDYAITGRPVYNVKLDHDPEILMKFLNRDYSDKMQLPDPSKYHISTVAKEFLSLLEE